MTPQTPELEPHPFYLMVKDLATELCKDLDYSEIYALAHVALVDKLCKELSLIHI